jgi:hypothetical protein
VLRLTTTILLMLPNVHAIDISYFDSETNPKMSWIVIDECLVEVKKDKVHDTCYIIKKVDKECGLSLNLGECHDNK